jgi:hypothetical protein
MTGAEGPLVLKAVAKEQDAAAAVVASQAKAEQIRQWVEDAGLMKDLRAREIVETLERKVAEATVARDKARQVSDAGGVRKQNDLMMRAREQARADLRSHVMSSYMQAQLAMSFPRSRVRKDVQVWQEQLGEYTSVDDFKAKNSKLFEKSQPGVKLSPDGKHVYLELTDIDLMVTMDQSNGKATILHNEEIKTGARDRPNPARDQLNEAYKALNEAADGGRSVMLLEAGKDVTHEIDLASMRSSKSYTRGPAGKGFEQHYEVTTADLDALIEKLLEPPKPGRPPS